MRTNLCACMRDRRWTADLVAGSAECDQSAHAEVRGLQFGFVAAEGLGLLQTAERESCGGSSFFGAFASGGGGNSCNSPKSGVDDQFVAGSSHRSEPRSTHPCLAQKVTLFQRAVRLVARLNIGSPGTHDAKSTPKVGAGSSTARLGRDR